MFYGTAHDDRQRDDASVFRNDRNWNACSGAPRPASPAAQGVRPLRSVCRKRCSYCACAPQDGSSGLHLQTPLPVGAPLLGLSGGPGTLHSLLWGPVAPCRPGGRHVFSGIFLWRLWAERGQTLAVFSLRQASRSTRRKFSVIICRKSR